MKERFSDQIEWNPNLALPIATADLTLANLAKEKEDTLLHVSEADLGYGDNSDDKVIQFNYVIDTARVIDVMHLPIIDPYDTTVYLDPIKIDDVSLPIGYQTFRDILVDNFSGSDYDDYDTQGSIVTKGETSAIREHLYSVGDVPPTVKDLVESLIGKEVKISDVFDYLVLKSGKVKVTCTNSTGFSIQGDVVISSYKDGKVVEFATFPLSQLEPYWMYPGGTQQATIYVDSAYLNSDFYYSFRNLKIANGVGILTDLDNTGLTLTMEMTDLVAYSGRAFVPAQELSTNITKYVTFRDEDMDRKLFQVVVDKGAFHYEIESTMGIATEFIAEFPTIDSMGYTPIRKYAAMTNSQPHFSNDWYLNNCNIDLTQNPEQGYNSLPIKISYKVHTTGGMLDFGPDQYIRIDITNTDSIFFAYLEGDMGKFDQDIFTETIDFDLSDYLGDFMSVDSLVLYDPKVSMTFNNPIGIGGNLEINLVGKDDNGNSVSVFNSGSNSIDVKRPSCDSVQQGLVTTSSIMINKNTSNIVDFVKLMPKTINYSGIFHVNSDIPDGQSIFNCASNKGEAKLGLLIELPLNLSAKNFILREDVDLNLSDLGDLSSIEKLRLYINSEHQFPVNATLKLSLLDTTQVLYPYIGTLDMIVLESATTENGKVARNNKKNTVEEITLEKGDSLLDDFLKANKLRLEVFLETEKAGETPVIFYSYYGLKFNIAADCKFVYTTD